MVALNRKRVILAAVAAFGLLGGCMKAGDGVGLDSTGKRVAWVDPCIANPTGPTCPPIDSCLLVPPPARCGVDSCLALPRSPACSTKFCQSHPTDAYCTPIVAKSSFATAVLPIIKEHCQECHKPGGLGYTTGKLNLSDDSAFVNLTTKMATVQTVAKGWYRVRPGLPDSSILNIKVSMATPKLPDGKSYGASMPQLKPLLPAPTVATIKQWITDGALP